MCRWCEVRNFASHKLRMIPDRSNRNLPMFSLEKWLRCLVLFPKLKIDFGTVFGFSQIFVSGFRSERKKQNPSGVDSGTRIHGYLCKKHGGPSIASSFSYFDNEFLSLALRFMSELSGLRNLQSESSPDPIKINPIQSWSAKFLKIITLIQSWSANIWNQIFCLMKQNNNWSCCTLSRKEKAK